MGISYFSSEYSQARGIRPLQDQTCFRIAWRFANKHQMFQAGFEDNFPGYPEN